MFLVHTTLQTSKRKQSSLIRILHYIPGFLYGGIESIFLDWYKNIDKNQFTFELLLRTQDDDASALKEYKSLGGKYYRLTTISNLLAFKKNVKDFFEKHCNYDILHVHDTDPFVMKYAKKYGIKKIILHSHTSNPHFSFKQQVKFVNEKLSKNLYADYAFACSKKAALWKFKHLVHKNNPVIIFHNAIDSKKYEFNDYIRKVTRCDLNVNNKFLIGHVGRLTYQKNQFYLLEIFKKIIEINQDSILIILGDGPDEKGLKLYAKKLDLEKKVIFFGARDDVADLLQAMDCFLLPSRYEGLPVTLIEAQAAGLPCFISDVVSEEADLIPKLIYRHSITDKPEIWAADIVDKARKTDRTNKRELIIKSGYDIKTEVKKLEQKYKEIINN